jgi:hypothetical protein
MNASTDLFSRIVTSRVSRVVSPAIWQLENGYLMKTGDYTNNSKNEWGQVVGEMAMFQQLSCYRLLSVSSNVFADGAYTACNLNCAS